ncbi:hypothetical protein J7I93_18620 [Bacillus sp. ISL-47]|uniref:hypothetical protein n=1 Tax=Bacillus sp. ISL-47 TaxID=2819130 RepID=UPI001BE640B0|nr:hypothetical protein [Bacillus sp. ISL-47]MBT2690187.1 hypothetical protein [Bacillus sp. ISL-47]MBT2710364.1 hypothetical protein [Pseudomonas sp. ISL-84]
MDADLASKMIKGMVRDSSGKGRPIAEREPERGADPEESEVCERKSILKFNKKIKTAEKIHKGFLPQFFFFNKALF